MRFKHSLISRIASRGLAGLGMALVACTVLAAQAKAEAATDAPEAAEPASQTISIAAAAVRGAFPAPGLGVRQIAERMQGLGYRDLQEIEWGDGVYEVKGRTAEGRLVRLYVDGHSGNVLSMRAGH